MRTWSATRNQPCNIVYLLPHRLSIFSLYLKDFLKISPSHLLFVNYFVVSIETELITYTDSECQCMTVLLQIFCLIKIYNFPLWPNTREFGIYRICANVSNITPMLGHIQRNYMSDFCLVFITIHALSVLAAKALASLRMSADSPEHWLIAYMI